MLDRDDLIAALEADPTHKDHPIAYAVQVPMQQGQQHAQQVLANLEHAIAAGGRDSESRDWIRGQLEAACRERILANAAARLGEIRAFGFLRGAEINVLPVAPGPSPTPDFDQSGTDGIAVEVHTKQMNEDEAKRLAHAGPVAEVFPAGRPMPGEATAENVAQKFAQIKPQARQAARNKPTLLWLDLQDRDWCQWMRSMPFR